MPNSSSKKSTGRKCSICTNEQRETINSQIATGVSFRGISRQFDVGDDSVRRHSENCLGYTIGVLIQEKKIEQAIDVHAEFREQLVFAKELRVAARSYLSDPNDPLKLTIIPRADEIEVVYFDYQDKDDKGNPKKKTAYLNVLLASIEEGATIEADKVQIKHVDLRKFALDAINTTDTCIDKFAKLGGEYKKEGVNPQDPETIKQGAIDLLVAGGMERSRAEILVEAPIVSNAVQ